MKIKTLLIAAALLQIGTTAFGAPNASNTNSVLTVSGKIDISVPTNGQVTVTVLKPGIKEEDFLKNPDIDDCFYLGETTIAADGSYSISFPMDDSDPFGDYTVVANGESTIYSHASQEDMKLNKAIEEIAAALNYGTLRDVLEKNRETLSIDKNVNDDKLLKAAKILFSERGSITTENYKSKIEAAIKSASQTNTSSNTGGGGGGGGFSGGGVSGGSYVAPNMGYIGEVMSADKTFTDVPDSHWAYSYVTDLANKGIVAGKEDGSFKPFDSIKREEFAKMLADAFLDVSKAEADGTFSDVIEGSWYEGYVYALYKNGLVSGTGDGLFGTGSEITRQDAAVMVYRCLSSAGVMLSGGNTVFTDSDIVSPYAQAAVDALSASGIVNGDENGMFNPKKSLTRAEAAKILSDALKLK